MYAWRHSSRWGRTALGATLITALGLAGALVEDALGDSGDYLDTGGLFVFQFYVLPSLAAVASGAVAVLADLRRRETTFRVGLATLASQALMFFVLAVLRD